MSKAKVTILGCGGSYGVPAIGNNWGVCDQNEPKNNRTRSSIAVQTDTTTLIIDTGAEFRTQLNREGISNVDAVLYTHYHGDHANGIEDIRPLAFYNKALMPIYASNETMDDLKDRFTHLFNGGASHKYHPPTLDTHILSHNSKGERVGDISFTTFNQDHGVCTSSGFRFGDFGYSVDIVELDDAAIKALKGINIWVVDAAGYNSTDNIVHASLKKIYELNAKIGAKQVYLTSLTAGMDYRTLISETPSNYAPAYDGLRLDIKLF